LQNWQSFHAAAERDVTGTASPPVPSPVVGDGQGGEFRNTLASASRRTSRGSTPRSMPSCSRWKPRERRRKSLRTGSRAFRAPSALRQI